MKRLIFILFLLAPILSYSQVAVKYRQATLDTLRLKDLPAAPDSILLYGTVYAYNDSIWFMDQNDTHYNLLRWLDSIAAETVRYYAVLDSLAVHDGNYITLRDSVRDVQDSLVVHDGHYYSLRDSVRAIVSGDDDIANDTYYTSYDVLGNPINVWKVDVNGNFYVARPQLKVSQNTEFDAGMIWQNIPLRLALYGDSVGYRYEVNGYELFKSYAIADGTGGLAERKTEFAGDVYVNDTLLSLTEKLNIDQTTPRPL